jgi:DNA primase
VNLDSGAFRCFACGARGADILAFAMQRHGLGFRDALDRLGREWGL